MSDLIETARALMALDDFRWRVGTADTEGDTADGDDLDMERLGIIDLSDPATRGCMEAWAEEVFGPEFTVAWRSGISGKPRGWNARWYTDGVLKSHVCGHDSKIEAIAAALLGAR